MTPQQRATRRGWVEVALASMGAMARRMRKDCADLGYPTSEADAVVASLARLQEVVEAQEPAAGGSDAGSD